MLQPSVVRIGRANQRLSVMDLSFPSQRQQLYHRTGTETSIFSTRENRSETDRAMESLGTNKNKEAFSSWVLPFPFPTVMFSLKCLCCFFFWHTCLSCISIPCQIKKHSSVYYSRSWRFIFAALHSRSLGRKVFSRVFFIFQLTGQTLDCLPLCLKAWTLTHLPCVLSAAACVVIGWHQTSVFSCSIGTEPVPVALAASVLQAGQRLQQTAPQAQPLFDCLCLHAAKHRIKL